MWGAPAVTFLLWLLFLALVLCILGLALRFFDRVPRAVSFRVSLAWTGFWMVLALAFGLLVHGVYEHHVWGFGEDPAYPVTGAAAMSAFLTAYLVETFLNLDNVFAIALIFTHYGVRLRMQYRVLYWGVLAALVVRGVLIGLGAQLYQVFPWFNYALGALLLLCAGRLLLARHQGPKPDRNMFVYLTQKILAVAPTSDGGHFFLRQNGHILATPLFIALLLVESTDFAFAVDSIPAGFAVTQDPFLVFTSNVFAMLGMRSLYFALLGVIDRFYYLRASVVVFLLFMGAKMLLIDKLYVPVPVTLAVLALILGIGVYASIRSEKRQPGPLVGPYAGDLEEYAMFTLRQARKVIVLMVGSTIILIGIAMLVL
ncbi:MAG: TerC/Alx family metal homeostasis membrane protein, partial [Candidatus Hydrogenedentes bacterium]|nr:TerC/Alx family metal homeostasis membrane protein [Candidatus Hydrogenedentota bacterium]